MVMDPANASELSQPVVVRSAEVTRRTPRPLPDSAEETSGLIIRLAGGGVTRGTPPHVMPVLPPPILIPMRQAPLPPAPEPESQSVSGDRNPHRDPSRERIPCLRCKNKDKNRIDSHGPEIKLDGHCSNCHKDGKSCDIESYGSDENFNAPLSSLNPQSSAISDGMPRPKPSTSNDNHTNAKVPDAQPNTSSSRRQIERKTPIIHDSRDREITDTIGGITTNDSISDGPRITPWWRRIFSRAFCFR